jgi:hypothetical protein
MKSTTMETTAATNQAVGSYIVTLDPLNTTTITRATSTTSRTSKNARGRIKHDMAVIFPRQESSTGAVILRGMRDSDRDSLLTLALRNLITVARGGVLEVGGRLCRDIDIPRG